MAWRTSSAEALDEAARRDRGRRRQGEWSTAAEHRPRLPVHRPVRPRDDAALGRRAPRSARATRARSTPTAPRTSQQDRRAPRASSTTSRSPRATSTRSRSGTTTCSASASWPHRARRGARSRCSPCSPPTRSRTTSASCSTARRRAGRINHYAFWVDTREELLHRRRHAHGERHPDRVRPDHPRHRRADLPLLPRALARLRIELNTGGYRNYVPDWEPNTWKPSLGSNNFYRNGAMPMSMTETFPPADGPSATEEGVSRRDQDALLNPYA